VTIRQGRRGVGSAIFTAAVAAALTAAAAQTAPQRSEDPDWPCQQRLVPQLTAPAFWNGPLDTQGDWQADSEIAELVLRLAPRRVTTEEGLATIADFAKTASGDRPRRFALTFCGLLAETDRQRAVLIEKLKGIGRRQRELADLVARLAVELRSIPAVAVDEAAAKRVDLQQRRDFTARNFEEVQRTIRYACEMPVGLDARLGAWARALQLASRAEAK
jgi:hypothetical protein